MLLLLLSLISPSHALDVEWELMYDTEGVKGSRGAVEDSKFYAFRGETTYDAEMERVLDVLMDNDRRTEWMMRLEKCEVLEQPSPYEYVLYLHFNLPMPLSDRDYVYRGIMKSLPTGQVELSLVSEEHPKSPETVGVRANLIDSRYLLTPQPDGTTHVAVEIMTDPRGSIPAWLVNLIQRSWPVETLNGIRAQLDKPHVGRFEPPPLSEGAR
jgi:hypothetical protein